MSEGIKETKEALLALVSLGKYVASLGADGFDLSDVGSLITKLVVDDKFKELLAAGVKGSETVPAELSQLDISESLELVALLVDVLRK